MKNKTTRFLFMLAIISINCLSGASLFAEATITGENYVCKRVADLVYKTEEGMMDYQWSVSHGGLITAGAGTDMVTISWRDAGDQFVYVSYLEPPGIGPIISGSYQVTVNSIPDDAGEMTGPVRICQGEVGIYSVPPIASANDYVWMLPEGSSIISGQHTNTVKVSYSITASYGNVAVYGANDCGEGNVSGFYPIAVNEIPPTPGITIMGNVLQSNAPDGNLWYFDGEPIPDAIKQEYEATQNGWYWTVVTIGGCSSAQSNPIEVVLMPTGIRDMEGSGFQIYPVPNDGRFILRSMDMDKSELTLQVYNNLGIMVYENGSLQWDGNSSCSVDLQSISPGTYAVILQN